MLLDFKLKVKGLVWVSSDYNHKQNIKSSDLDFLSFADKSKSQELIEVSESILKPRC